MYHIKPISRAAAAALAAVQFFTIASGAAFDSAFSYSYPIGEGTSYTRTEGRNSAGYQRANILTYTPNSTVMPRIVYAGDKLYGSRAAILDAASYLEGKSGQQAVGGVNADFFVLDSGIPIGLVVEEGKLISSDAWQYAIGFRADGSAIIGQPTANMAITGASGRVVVSYFNKTRTQAGAYLLDHNYNTNTRFSREGVSIVLERLDDTPVKIGGTVRMRVVQTIRGSDPLTLTPGQMILTKSNDASVPTWVDFPVGEEVTLSVYSGDPAWNDVQYAVGGKLLMSGGSITTDGIDSASRATARSAAGLKPDGTLILYENDGLQSGYSAGLTAYQLGQEMKDLGCQTALCLDGGGSSTMAIRQPGTTAPTLVSSPSDGSARAVANCIFLLSSAAADGVTTSLALQPTYRYVLPGGSTTFTVTGADAAYAPAPVPDGVTFSAEGGTVEGQTFTAGSTPGTAVVTGTGGGASESMQICITDAPESVSLQSGGADITGLSLKAGQTVDLDALAFRLGVRLGAQDELFTWTVTPSLGTVSASGVFTASKSLGIGTLTCAYGSVGKTIPILITPGSASEETSPSEVTQPSEETSPSEVTQPSEETPPSEVTPPSEETPPSEVTPPVHADDAQPLEVIADFEEGQFFVSDELMLTRVSGYGNAIRGDSSLSATFADPTLLTGTITVPETDVSAMKFVSVWAGTESAGGTLEGVFTNAEGEEFTAAFPPLSGGVHLLSISIPEGAQTLTALRFTRTEGDDSALLLDQISVTADHALTDTGAPSLSLEQTALTVEADTAATLIGTATMESGAYAVRADQLTVRLDGQPLTEAVRMEGAVFTIDTGTLSSGTHSVTIDAIDDAGNRARVSAVITAGDAANPFADTNAHWASGYASLLQTRGIMQGEVNDGIAYFRPDRKLSRMEFAVTLARLCELETSYSGETAFADDADIPDWARGAVYAVSQAGLMNGKQSDNGLFFDPRADISRAEVMTVIGRTLPNGFPAGSIDYWDADDIPAWAVEHVQNCVAAGIVAGYEDNTLRPLASVTRAEIAKILALL